MDTLGTLGHTVMISNYMRYHRLMLLLRRLTDEPIAFAMGLRNVRDLFDAKYYTDMPGGILQALGQLFQGPTQLYVCPAINHDTNHVERPSEFQAPDRLRHLYAYLLENGHIQTIPVDEALLNIYSRDVLSMIERGDPAWETLVPRAAGQRIRERGYFGCTGPAPADVS